MLCNKKCSAVCITLRSGKEIGALADEQMLPYLNKHKSFEVVNRAHKGPSDAQSTQNYDSQRGRV